MGTEAGGSFLRTEGVSVLDEATLDKIATDTKGKYYRAENTETLVDTFNEILASSNQSTPINLSQPLLVIALVLLFSEWGLISTKFRSVP